MFLPGYFLCSQAKEKVNGEYVSIVMVNITPFARDRLEEKSMVFTQFYVMQGTK